MKTCEIILPRKFWKVLVQIMASNAMTFFLVFTCFWAEEMDICGRDDLFLVFTFLGAENWTSADMMTLKEPVLLLRGENVVTLLIAVPRSGCKSYVTGLIHGWSRSHLT